MDASPRATRALLALALASVTVGLVTRVVVRGGEVPGWDLLLATEGQYLLATRGVCGALAETFHQVRHFWLPPSAYSVIYGLIPGALNRAWPSIFWQPAVVFLAWIVTLALLLVATGWGLRSARGWTLALLGWGASPSLLSYSVEGYPWGGGMLPFALVLAMALAWARRPWAVMIPLLAIAWELPWHGYELAKTTGLVVCVGALFAPDVDRLRRMVWIGVGASQMAAAQWLWPSANMIAFGHGNVGAGVGIPHALPLLPAGAARLAEALFGSAPLIVPVLTITGAVALRWAGSARRVLTISFLVQLGLVLLLAAAGPGLLRGRRFQVVEGLSLAAVLAAGRSAPPRVRAVLVALLLAGNVWTMIDLATFARTPPASRAFSLPGVASAEGVGVVDRPAVRWAEALVRRARAGGRIVVLHGQQCPCEDVTNPAGVLERLYLRLGHETFARQVIAVGVEGPRYVTVPVVDVRTVLDTLAPGQLVDIDSTCRAAMGEAFRELEARFVLEPTGGGLPPRFPQFRLVPRAG
ncbi:MAG: hypothetical protein U0807_12570 [Candidatus Binatia bacterium]